MNVDRRVLTVGVSGHRPNRLDLSCHLLRRRCLEALGDLKRGSRHAGHVAISALAEGADRAFAAAAIEAGYELAVALPFPSHDYVQTFSSPDGNSAFEALLGEAAQVSTLPGDLTATGDAYRAVGQLIVARSDVLIAIWDGEAGRGTGGTPDVIAMAIAASKPVVWIDATGRNPRRLLRAQTTASPLSLDALKRRARPLGPRRCARLSAGLTS